MLRIGGYTLVLILTSVLSVVGQKNCNCVVDTERILLNVDLDHFLYGLSNQVFRGSAHKDNIPKFILDQLDCLTKGFSLANPNQDYQCCCTSPQNLPKRKLLYLAKGKDIFVMTYLTGGYGVETHLLLIEFSGEKIKRLWTGFVDRDLRSPGKIASYIRGHRCKEWGLNTNIVGL